MSRFMARLSAVVVVLALGLIVLPIADARPLAGPRSTVEAPAGWMAALSTWFSGLFTGSQGTSNGGLRTTVGRDTAPVPSKPPIMQVESGACIDPNGHPAPCSPGH